MGVGEFNSPEERAAHFRALLSKKQAQSEPETVHAPEFDADLVPDVEDAGFSQAAIDLEEFVRGIDPLEAYRRLIGKMDPVQKGSNPEVHISCPIPGHADNNPSAWINVETGLWTCGGCGIGGDVFDLAAIGLGYSWPESYKDDKESFVSLKRELAETFGMAVTKSPLTGRTIVSEILEEPDEDEEPAPPSLSVVPALAQPPDAEFDISDSDIVIDWESIVPQDTFLERWLRALAIDHFPHEYHFWSGLLCVGLAASHNIVLLDRKNVKGNLYVCILGESGTGKTQAIEPVQDLLREVLPFTEDPYLDPEGVRILSSPNSGERLIDLFHYEVKDSSTQAVLHQANVTGLLQENEFSELMSRAGRMGSSLKEVLINMFDASVNREITTTSRGSGDKKAMGPFMSLLTTTQPDAVSTFLRQSDVNSGTLNRFVFVNGRARLDPVGLQTSEPDISDPIDAYKRLANWAYSKRDIPLAGTPAEPVWLDFFDRELKLIKKGEVRQDPIFARTDLILKKLILLFCINEQKAQPDADLVERVLTLYPYLRLTYSQFSEKLSQTESTMLEEKIEEVCRQADSKPPSMRDIIRVIGKKHSNEEIARAIKNLMSVQKIEEVVMQGKRGPKTTRYKWVS